MKSDFIKTFRQMSANKNALKHSHGSGKNYDEGFNLIDWEIMTKVGLTDDHAKRIKMAECLSDRVIPVRAFKCFYVSSESVKIYVESVLHKCGVNFPPPFVNIMPQWFA